MGNVSLRISKDWYPELSYLLIGLAYTVQNQLGYGYHEKYYQRAYEEELAAPKIPYQRECVIALKYKQKIIGRYVMDFVVDRKVVVEWKVASDVYTRRMKQVLAYLKTTGIHLGLLIVCRKEGIKEKRIVN